MILGMSISAFTALHVVISLIALFAGGLVLAGMIAGKDRRTVTGAYLGLTALTSITGFLCPASQILPSHIFGIISVAVLAVAATGYYGFHLAGAWRPAYVVTALTAFYLNVFVAVVQSFLKIRALNALAPTGSEPAFLITQVAVLVAFVSLGFFAFKRFRHGTAP